jgi:hypothetical protein
MTPSPAEQALYQDLLSVYARAGAEVVYETDKGETKSYWPKRFLQAVKRAEKNDDLIPFASRLVTEQEPSRGFFILKKAGRLDLTVEALLCDHSKPYRAEFDFDVLERARQRLAAHGFDTLAEDPRGDEEGGEADDGLSSSLRGSNLPGSASRSSVRSGSNRLGAGQVDRRSGLLATRLHGVVSGVEVRDQMVALLRADDEVGVMELLRAERNGFAQDVVRLLQNAGDKLDRDASPEALRPVEVLSRGLVDRRLGSLLPIMEYRPELLAAELKALGVLAGRAVPTRSSSAAWLLGSRWPISLVSTILGTAAVALERPEIVVDMWEQRLPFDEDRPLPIMRLGEGLRLGQALLNARPNTHVRGAALIWYPAFTVSDMELLSEHYPEIMSTEQTSLAVEGFLSRAGDYFWLCSALAGRDKLEAETYWAGDQVHPWLSQRLAGDPALAARYGQVFDVDAGDVVKTLRGWVNAI